MAVFNDSQDNSKIQTKLWSILKRNTLNDYQNMRKFLRSHQFKNRLSSESFMMIDISHIFYALIFFSYVFSHFLRLITHKNILKKKNNALTHITRTTEFDKYEMEGIKRISLSLNHNLVWRALAIDTQEHSKSKPMCSMILHSLWFLLIRTQKKNLWLETRTKILNGIRICSKFNRKIRFR